MIKQTRIILISLLISGSFVLAGCSTLREADPPAPVPAVVKRPPKLGLALGGGAARGVAHVGVIQALEEAGIKADLVVGTSAGSLVAALYASGRTSSQLVQVSESMEEAAFTDWTLPFFSRGMLRGDALGRYVNTQLQGKLIEQMPMPLGIVATALQSGQGVMFQRGDAGMAVRASSAVPALFVPVRIGSQEFVDGGLVSPVPVRYTLQILMQTFAIMGKSINSHELREADIVVRPALAGVGGADFAARRRSIDAGKAAMQRLIPQLKAAMEAKSH